MTDVSRCDECGKVVDQSIRLYCHAPRGVLIQTWGEAWPIDLCSWECIASRAAKNIEAAA